MKTVALVLLIFFSSFGYGQSIDIITTKGIVTLDTTPTVFMSTYPLYVIYSGSGRRDTVWIGSKLSGQKSVLFEDQPTQNSYVGYKSNG